MPVRVHIGEEGVAGRQAYLRVPKTNHRGSAFIRAETCGTSTPFDHESGIDPLGRFRLTLSGRCVKVEVAV
jgi:hypothetical protein